MPQNEVVSWLLRLLLLDKLVQFLAKTWPHSLRLSTWKEAFGRLPLLIAFVAWWKQRRPLTRHVLSNLVVGLGIAIFLWNLHGVRWLHEIEDIGIDWVMRMQWGTQPTRLSLAFALLDIDEATYRAWGEPFHTPRDRLVDLIDYAVQGGAKLIVVDIDLSQRGHDPAADAKLQDYLARYAAPGRPPLVFSRVFRESLDPRKDPYRSERRSFLEADARIAQSPLIHWGSPLFNLDQDRVLRRWRLWEPVCTDGQPGIVPSIQLLAVALRRVDGNDPGATVREVQQTLAPLAPTRCDPVKPGAEAHGGQGSSRTVEIANLKLHADPDAVAQRILYTLPWRLQPGQAYPLISGDAGSPIPALFIRSALPIGHQAVDPAWLKGRVVVIGGSYAESRDRHPTPLGEMPGALVLINAIQSLHQHDELEAPPLSVKLLVEAVLIVVMSLAFAGFNSFLGMVASGAFIILALLPLSFVVFRYGVWLDFAIPLLAVQLHQMVAEFEEAQHRRAATHRHHPASPISDSASATATEQSHAAPSHDLNQAPAKIVEEPPAATQQPDREA